MFAPGIASTGLHDDMGPAFSPDGNEVFFRTAGRPYGFITTMKQVDGVWSGPETAFWSGRYPDGGVAFSHDGRRLFFGSRRPLSGSGPPKEKSDIWYSEKTADGWDTPQHLGAPVNTEGNDEYLSSIAGNGSLYLTRRTVADGNMTFDLLRATFEDGQYAEPEAVELHLDRKYQAIGIAIDAEERFLVLSISGMEDGLGQEDLYASFRKDDGTWTHPVNLGEEVNSDSYDWMPRISPDGKYLFFVSWRYEGESHSETPLTYDEMMSKKRGHTYGWGADIYWVSMEAVTRLKPDPLD